MLHKRLLVLLLGASLSTYAYDTNKKFGLGLGGGVTAPAFGNQFNDLAKTDIAATAYARYHFSRSYGIDGAYSRNEFNNTNMAMNVYDILGFYRLTTSELASPIIGIGAGLVDLINYSPTTMKLGLRARIGVEYALHESLSLGGHLDYHHVSKLNNNLPMGTVHVFVPKIALTWYF